MFLSIPKRLTLKELSRDLMILLVILLMLASFNFYLVWKIPISLLYLFTFLSFTFFFLKNKEKSKWLVYKRNYFFILIVLFLLYLFEYNCVTPKGVLPFIGNFCALFCSCFFFLLSNEYKSMVFRALIKTIAFITLISLFGWILFILGVNLPFIDVQFDDSNYYNHRFYYFFLYNVPTDAANVIPRFASFFLEPGHLASTFTLLVFLCKFDIKRWEVIVFIISILFSLSLAGYVLLFFGFLLYTFCCSQRRFLQYIFVILFILLGAFVVSKFYNKGDNIINDKIFSRLEFNNGRMVGYNRETVFLKWKYRTHFLLNKKYVWFGYGRYMYGEDSNGNIYHANYASGSAGWKRYYMTRGIIGTGLIILLLISVLLIFKSKLGICFFILFLICNFVRDYPTSELWMYLFFFALSHFYYNNKSVL